MILLVLIAELPGSGERVSGPVSKILWLLRLALDVRRVSGNWGYCGPGTGAGTRYDFSPKFLCPQGSFSLSKNAPKLSPARDLSMAESASQASV